MSISDYLKTVVKNDLKKILELNGATIQYTRVGSN